MARPKGSTNKRKEKKGQPEKAQRAKAVQPCPLLRNADHDSNCQKCGGSGEVKG